MACAAKIDDSLRVAAGTDVKTADDDLLRRLRRRRHDYFHFLGDSFSLCLGNNPSDFDRLAFFGDRFGDNPGNFNGFCFWLASNRP